MGALLGTERYLNLSVKTAGSAANYPNRIDHALRSDSDFARVSGNLPCMPPRKGDSAVGLDGDDGAELSTATYLGDRDSKTGLYLLEHAATFNLLCIPPDRRFVPGTPETDLDPLVRQAAAAYCADRRAFYIVDPPSDWAAAVRGGIDRIDPEQLGIAGESAGGIEVARNAAVYFPRIWKEDPLRKSKPALFAPCGAVAGVIAATDAARGVWKAPAGLDAMLVGIQRLEVDLNDGETGALSELGINCLRNFPTSGPLVWGARTLRGGEAFEDDYKYIPVRRLTLTIEDALYRGTQWAVFEPNNESLWSALRLQAGSYLRDLARQGAFYDFAVRCDATTTTADDIAQGIVNILVQFAPLRPAEFIVLRIQQQAGAA